MKSKGETVRKHIVGTAHQLFYRRGFNQTSFSDIAAAANVPKGNFYYYFKCKDDILAAVVEHRLQAIQAQLQLWDDELSDARDCLRRFVDMLHREHAVIVRYGCPMGSLNLELCKTQPELHAHATRMFDLYRDWLEHHFSQLGYTRDAADLTLHLLAATQGAALIANTYKDAQFLQREADRLRQWIDSL